MRRESSGYTFIEIMVVLSITGLIFALGFASFRDFARRQLVLSTTREIKGDLRLAQEESISGKKPDTCLGSLDGYKFLVTPSQQKYEIFAACTGGDVLVKTKSFPEEVNIGAPLVNPIIFKPIGVGTNIPSGETEVIDVSVSGSTFTLQVSIGSSGDIQ